jgi:hypothetical protein
MARDAVTTGFETLSVLLRKSLGLPLVLLGFVVVYFKGSSWNGNASDYLALGFASSVTLVGLGFMAVELRRVGETTADLESAVSSSDLELTIRQLAKNLDIQRGQATQGFVAALALMVLGVCVIFVGAIGDLFDFTAAGRLTTVAGTIVEAVSGLGLLLFRRTFATVNKTSDALLEVWKILAAFDRAESLPDSERANVQVQLIGHLVGHPLTSVDIR